MSFVKTGIILLAAAACASAIEPAMSAEQREMVVKLLRESQKETLDLVSSISDEQWKWKPAPNRWSVGECVEHIMLSEGLLRVKMEEALAGAPNPDWQAKTAGKTEFLLKVMAPRQGKAEAPESIQPQSKLTRVEVMAKLAQTRAKTLKFAETTEATMNDHTAEHPFPVFNTLSAYQWLLYIPLHNMRHDKQIQEVMATEGYPK